ncbi:MAG: putative Zn finger protein [Hyphomicrobiaceae bacterium]
MSIGERKSVSLGERWRREATRDIDDQRLAAALEALPNIRKPMVRIRAGGIGAEMEGAMGSIHEVSLQIRTLPMKDWPTLIRVLRRSKSIIEALEQARVPRSFDRLVARVIGQPLFPDARSVTYGCSCDLPEEPCRHVLALHELFARRLDEKPWELLMLRGVDLHGTLAKVKQAEVDIDLPPLAYGVPEEPVLYPDAEDADLDQSLGLQALRWLVGDVSPRAVAATLAALNGLSDEPQPPEDETKPPVDTSAPTVTTDGAAPPAIGPPRADDTPPEPIQSATEAALADRPTQDLDE